jgi:hypothetical protein
MSEDPTRNSNVKIFTLPYLPPNLAYPPPRHWAGAESFPGAHLKPAERHEYMQKNRKHPGDLTVQLDNGETFTLPYLPPNPSVPRSRRPPTQ